MPQPEFDSSAWTEQLANALEALAPTTELYVEEAVGEQLVSHDEYRALARQAEDHLGRTRVRSPSARFIQEEQLPTALRALRTHPLISSALSLDDNDGQIIMGFPRRVFRAELAALAGNLVKLAIRQDGRHAAEALHRFLDLGRRRELTGHEITGFYGLKTSGRIDIADGAFLAPFEDVKDEFRLQDFVRGSAWDNPVHEGRHVTVLVREFAWGPGVASPREDRFWHATYAFPVDDEVILSLLCAAMRSPSPELMKSALFIRVPMWLEGIHPIFGDGVEFGYGGPPDSQYRESELSSDAVAGLQEMAQGWLDYQGDRDALEIAARRIRASFSRTGKFEAEDRVLDVAIALEIMYESESPETTYGLASRAGWFLGNDPTHRLEIFDRVRDFYKVRSSLVHRGRPPRGSRDALDRASLDGTDLALETLRNLLGKKRPPEWNRLAMSAPEV